MREKALILVVDDTPSDALLLSRAMSRAGYMTQTACDGLAAVAMALDLAPDLILMDMSMPGQDGLQTCRTLKADPRTSAIPVIFVTAHSTSEHVLPAFEAGGSDYVCKPIRVDEILARVSVQLRLREAEQALVERNATLETLSNELAETNADLARQSRVDVLTGLLNRRAWDERALLEAERAERHHHVYGVLMLDVDFFKAFNDSQGHQAGDDCLKTVAERIQSTCRNTDLVGRWGGEEFVVLAPETSGLAATKLAERIRQSVWNTAIRHPASPAGRLTVSIGVAASGSIAVGDALKLADSALYRAKTAGRNLVYHSDGTIPQPTSKSDHQHGLAPADDHPNSQSTASVLIVEDNRTNRMVYRGCLAKETYQITEVENGQAALVSVSEHRPDVIIMDVMMPVMDGLECTRRLKSDPETRDIPIIIASARSAPDEILAGLSAGADEYLTKPIRTTELTVRVRSMVRLSHERQDLLHSYHLRAEQIRVLTVLVDLCRNIGNALTTDEVLGHAVEALAQVAMSRRVSVMLPDADRTVLTVARSKGLDPNVAQAAAIPIGSAIAGKVFKTGRPIVVNTETDAQERGHWSPSDSFASIPLMSAPIGCGAEILGVLNITERIGERAFEPRELEYVDLVASIVGSTLLGLRHRVARNEARDMIVVALAKLAEHRDNDTARHVDRVTRYARVLAESLQKGGRFCNQITDQFVEDLERAVPLHDIGKVAIPDSILRKPGRLSLQEMQIMQTHANIGADTLRSVIEKVPDADFLKLAEQVIRSHHEWFDGTGYPEGLIGDRIPLAARIVALADVYDALTTDRVYKQAISHGEAVRIIVFANGSQFDPAIVAAFLESDGEFRHLAREMADPASRRSPRAPRSLTRNPIGMGNRAETPIIRAPTAV